LRRYAAPVHRDRVWCPTRIGRQGALTPAGDKAIPVTGIWKLKGAQVCRTLAPIQPEEICETWVKSGAKQATIQVDGKDASINRWQ